MAFNNLYSGTAGGTGVCNRGTPGANDDGVDATVLWSYNVSAIGGAVTTSPVISWDNSTGAGSVLGTKVAFVESAPGRNAHFHVLAFKAGDGQDTTDADGLQNTLKPVQITTFVTNPASRKRDCDGFGVQRRTPEDPAQFPPPLSITVTTIAYVGNDVGDLYRIKDVFCPSFNTDAGCMSGAGPSLDTSWGSGGVVEVGGGCGTLTGAVEDAATGDVFVGCSTGALYGYTSSGQKLGSAITVGNGSSFGGIVVSPLVDSSKGYVYAVSGTNGTSPTMIQVPIAKFSVNNEELGGFRTSAREKPQRPVFQYDLLFERYVLDLGDIFLRLRLHRLANGTLRRGLQFIRSTEPRDTAALRTSSNLPQTWRRALR